MYELEQEPQIVNLEEQGLVASMEIQVARIKTLKAEKKNLNNSAVDQDASGGTDRKSYKIIVVFSELSLQYVRMPSNVMKHVRRCCARKTAQLFLFNGVKKRKWFRRDNKVSCNSVIISSGVLIAPYPSKFILLSKK